MTDNNRLHSLANRVSTLYSLPAAAMEVVRLTNDPTIDAAALTNCLEKDPALTVKVLKVVNSSLFGLSREVSDLNQAIALLGSGPLKLLVLGFSLPDKLFDGAKKELLAWYWNTSLTRAVAARQLSKSLWNDPGHEAFLAALLQDIGLLTLLQELDEAFAKFLDRVISENGNLALAEKDALGFEHRQLSGAMLENWKLPEVLVEAVSMTSPPLKLSRSNTPAGEIAKVLHLADLVAQLVGQRRLGVLPEILESGKLFRDMTKQQLYDLVGELQPQVDQLADILSLELPDGRDYLEVLKSAHENLSKVAIEAAETLAQLKTDDQICEELLAESQELVSAVESFLKPIPSSKAEDTEANSSVKQETRGDAPHLRTDGEQLASTSTSQVTTCEELRGKITEISRGCRMRRTELSLLFLELDSFEELVEELGPSTGNSTLHLLSSMAQCNAESESQIVSVAPGKLAIVVADCDRRQAVAMATAIFRQFADVAAKSTVPSIADSTLSCGVATVTSIFKNFSADNLIEGANRCLGAARSTGGTAVKSIEIH